MAVAEAKTVKAVVARGRSLQSAKVLKDAKDHVQDVILQTFGPGAEVELPEAEVKLLRARGVLLAEGQSLPPLAAPQDVVIPR